MDLLVSHRTLCKRKPHQPHKNRLDHEIHQKSSKNYHRMMIFVLSASRLRQKEKKGREQVHIRKTDAYLFCFEYLMVFSGI